MIMAGLKFTGDVPFRTVFITGLVRDERGQKMSKSKGNVVDPLEVMDEVGADALRFTLTAMAAPGMDIPLSEGRMTGYRQFINKIWNASRFVLMHVGGADEPPALPPFDELGVVDLIPPPQRRDAEVKAFEIFPLDVAADRLPLLLARDADWHIGCKGHLRRTWPSATARGVIAVHDSILRLPSDYPVRDGLWQRPRRRRPTIALCVLARTPSWADDQPSPTSSRSRIVTTMDRARGTHAEAIRTGAGDD
jgi:valyl-tRNA synthetase